MLVNRRTLVERYLVHGLPAVVELLILLLYVSEQMASKIQWGQILGSDAVEGAVTQAGEDREAVAG